MSKSPEAQDCHLVVVVDTAQSCFNTALHYAMWGNQSGLFLLPPIILLGTSLSISWVEAHNRDILIQHRNTTGSFYHHTSPSTASSECLYTPIPPVSLSSQYI